MPKLKVVGKDRAIHGGTRKLEIHWKAPDGEYKLDTYTDNYTVKKDDSGMTTVVQVVIGEGGKLTTITTSYGYGEDRKIVETVTA